MAAAGIDADAITAAVTGAALAEKLSGLSVAGNGGGQPEVLAYDDVAVVSCGADVFVSLFLSCFLLLLLLARLTRKHDTF